MLLRRENVRLNLADLELGGDCLRRGAIVSCQHDDTDAIAPELLEGRECSRLDRIGDPDDSGSPAVNRDEYRSGAVAAKLLGGRLQVVAIDAEVFQQGGVANRGSALANFCGHALAGQRAEFANVFDFYAPFGGSRNECGSEWMFTCSLETTGERQDRV